MMKTVIAFATLAAGASALVARDATCCFSLTASGGESGTLGQLGDGQNRIKGGLPAAQYCIDSSGSIKDSSGRGCILTPPTTQFQCDLGATPTSGFSVSSGGQLLYEGSSHFVACQTGDNGEYNVYTNPPSDAVTGCTDVTLTASGCSGSGSASSSVSASASASSAPSSSASASVSTHASTYTPSSTSSSSSSSSSEASVPVSTLSPAQSSTPAPQSTAPAPQSSIPVSHSSTPVPQSSATPSQTSASQPSASSSGCSTSLSAGNYEYPHLIIAVDSSAPSKAPGSSYNGTVTSTISSIFNFDIPQSDSGKQCSLVFLFPKKEDLETSSFSFSGNGAIDFAQLQTAATASTSASNAPAVKTDYGVTNVSPGNSYTITTFSCPAGEAIAFELKNAGTTDLNYFQDYNPSPLGLYITVC